MLGRARAVFLDRDGTLVHSRHSPSRPEDLLLFTGIGPYLWRLQRAGLRLVVITDQPGLARGLFTEADLRAMHDYLTEELARFDVHLDAIYWCPHHPEGSVPELATHCTCRKPAPGMLMQAAADLGLDLRHSWLVGDSLDDIEAGHQAGVRGVLVDRGTEGPPTSSLRRPDYVAHNTQHALRLIATIEGLTKIPAELAYRPPTWRTIERRRAW